MFAASFFEEGALLWTSTKGALLKVPKTQRRHLHEHISKNCTPVSQQRRAVAVHGLAMDIAGIGFTVISEARNVITSTKTRIAKYRDSQDAFETLAQNLDRLMKHIAEVERLVGKFPSALPKSISAVFNETLVDVRDSFKDEHSTVPQSISKSFAGSSSSPIGKVKSKVLQFTRANELSAEIEALQTKVDKASSQLLHLISMLANAIKLEDQQAALASELHCLRTSTQENLNALLQEVKNLQIAGTSKAVYRPAKSTPKLNHTIILDLEARDDKGKPVTPESRLKHAVLSSDSSESVTVAAGVMMPAYGILGMAGVGKTVALQGLGHDKDIEKRFHDGVHFMTFGRGATTQSAIGEIAKVLTLTGGSVQAQRVAACTTLRKAVDYAVPWFEGKACLYLLDDLWPAQNLSPGYLLDLRQLLRGSPESRMAISTRSVAIASEAGLIVDFAPREVHGIESIRIFMAHANRSPSQTVGDLSSSVRKILSMCAGLPIALSVVGCAVALLVRLYGSFERACDAYARKLQKKRTGLGDEDTTEGTSLNAGILLSLEFLEVEFQKWQRKNCLYVENSIGDLYTSLCVLENQTFAPVSVLGRLWKLDEDAALDVANLFCGMSLATMSLQQPAGESSEERGIVLHDLLLEFCHREAGRKMQSRAWHTQLLNGYLGATRQEIKQQAEAYVFLPPRPWWSSDVPKDSYIHSNLARHLSCSGQTEELAALLLDARWTELRAKIGGILALEADFELLDGCIMERHSSTERDAARRGFKQIFKAVQLSWGRRLMDGLRPFQFQVCGRLLTLKKENPVVDAYFASLEMHTPKPYLRPMSTCFPSLNRAPLMEIPVRGDCWSVVCSPCGRYVAANAETHIVIIELSTGVILRRLCCHTEMVSSLAFTEGSKKLVSGSWDKTIIVWDWKSLGSHRKILAGHNEAVTGVAVSRGGKQIFSSSCDRTVRIWDASTGSQIDVISQRSAIMCFAICGEDRRIALGLDDGTLTLMDIWSRELLFEDTQAHEDAIDCISFSPNGSFLATGSRDKTVGVWNSLSGARLGRRLEGHKSNMGGVAFSPDGKQIASSSWDGTIRLWDIDSLDCVGISPQLFTWMKAVSFTNEGSKIVCGSRDSIVRVWDALLGTESEEQTYGHSMKVLGVAISRNGLLVASASSDRTVRLWDTDTGEQIGSPMEGHAGAVNCVAFNYDGQMLVSGSDDGTLRMWDTEKNTQVGDSFEGHNGKVLCVSFSSDGFRVLSGSSDSTVRLWNVQTQLQIGDEIQAELIHCVSESPDGCYIVCGNSAIELICNRESRAILWSSSKHESEYGNAITDREAENILCSCAQSSYLSSRFFPIRTGDLYCAHEYIISNFLGKKILLGKLPPSAQWKFNTGKSVLTTGLQSGAVAIFKLIK